MKDCELAHLAVLNQIGLESHEGDAVRAFFAARASEAEKLCTVDTENTEMTVHVMPIAARLREDEVVQGFSREEMQSGAPMTDAGYFCVPRVLEG